MKNLDVVRPLLSKLFCWESIDYRSIDMFNVKILKKFGEFDFGTKFKRINLDIGNKTIRLFNEKDQLLGKYIISFNIVEVKSDRSK